MKIKINASIAKESTTKAIKGVLKVKDSIA
jgi:hypothetical protein